MRVCHVLLELSLLRFQCVTVDACAEVSGCCIVKQKDHAVDIWCSLPVNGLVMHDMAPVPVHVPA